MADGTATKLPESVEVAYWTIRGLGAPLRMMVMAAGVPLKATCYDATENGDGTGFDISNYLSGRSALREKNPLANLPYVVCEDKFIAQTNACMTYLGRRLNMLGDNETETILAEELLCEAMDLRNAMTDMVYGPSMGETQVRGLLSKQAKSGGMWKFEQILRAKQKSSSSPSPSSPCFVGTRLSAPDFHIWELVDQYIVMADCYKMDSPVKDLPLLASFHEQFAKLPENKKYFDSTLSKFPMNNKMAKFGACPKTNKTWTMGQEYDFKTYQTTTF